MYSVNCNLTAKIKCRINININMITIFWQPKPYVIVSLKSWNFLSSLHHWSIFNLYVIIIFFIISVFNNLFFIYYGVVVFNATFWNIVKSGVEHHNPPPIYFTEHLIKIQFQGNTKWWVKLYMLISVVKAVLSPIYFYSIYEISLEF